MMTLLLWIACSSEPDQPAQPPEPIVEPAPDKKKAKPDKKAGKKSKAKGDKRATIVPGKSFGPVKGGMSRDEIAALFPKIELENKDIHVGEGHTLPGLVVPLKEGREFSVLFETDARTNAVTVQDVGKAWQYEGVGNGSNLDALHAALGKPFTFLGFGWDYSGTVMISSTAWKPHDGKIWVRLSPENSDSPLYDQMIGDREFQSDVDGMEDLDVRVYDFSVRLH